MPKMQRKFSGKLAHALAHSHVPSQYDESFQTILGPILGHPGLLSAIIRQLRLVLTTLSQFGGHFGVLGTIFAIIAQNESKLASKWCKIAQNGPQISRNGRKCGNWANKQWETLEKQLKITDMKKCSAKKRKIYANMIAAGTCSGRFWLGIILLRLFLE